MNYSLGVKETVIQSTTTRRRHLSPNSLLGALLLLMMMMAQHIFTHHLTLNMGPASAEFI